MPDITERLLKLEAEGTAPHDLCRLAVEEIRQLREREENYRMALVFLGMDTRVPFPLVKIIETALDQNPAQSLVDQAQELNMGYGPLKK